VTAAPGAEIRVEGLAELRRALRKAADAEQLTGVRNALRAGAGLAATNAQGRVPVRSGRARASIRPTVSGNKAFVVGGRRTVAYYGWLDFGSRTPKRGNSRRVGPWRGSGRGPAGGRFIYPAIEATRPQIARQVADALEEVLGSDG